MTEEKKTALLNAINEYYTGEEWDEIAMEDLEGYLEKGSIGLACTTEKDYHEVQVEYNFNSEQYEYFVDYELIETEPCSIDDFIEEVEGADFCELLVPCTGYVNGMYEPLEDEATEVLGLNDDEYAEVYPDGDGDGHEYIVVVWKHRSYERREYRVNDMKELSTAKAIEG